MQNRAVEESPLIFPQTREEEQSGGGDIAHEEGVDSAAEEAGEAVEGTQQRNAVNAQTDSSDRADDDIDEKQEEEEYGGFQDRHNERTDGDLSDSGSGVEAVLGDTSQDFGSHLSGILTGEKIQTILRERGGEHLRGESASAVEILQSGSDNITLSGQSIGDIIFDAMLQEGIIGPPGDRPF